MELETEKTENQTAEQNLTEALRSHANQIVPSAEAFFKINYRIARYESANRWHPRNLFERKTAMRPKLSAAFAMLLLIALTAATTVLLTRETPTQSEVSTLSTSESGHVANDLGNRQETVELPEQSSGSESSSNVANMPEPELHVETEPVVPSEVEEALPATSPTVPAPPPLPELHNPHTEFSVIPLQIASRGYPEIFEAYRETSPMLGYITLDVGHRYDTTLATVIDSNGEQWLEITSPQTGSGWAKTAAITVQPAELSAEQSSSARTSAESIVNMFSLASQTGQPAVIAERMARALPISSRGVYLLSALEDGTLVSTIRLDTDRFKDLVTQVYDETNLPLLGELGQISKTLGCLSQEQILSDASALVPVPPVVARLHHVVLSSQAGCGLVVYYDFLNGQPEIIGLSDIITRQPMPDASL